MHESDRRAVTQVVNGDGNAFQSLVERHSKYVFHVAYRLTGSSQDAEDVVQETFLKAYRQLSRFEARADFRTWLHRIAVNCAIDYIRARRSREIGQDVPDLEDAAASDGNAGAQPSPHRMALSAQIDERVREAMKGLTPMERAAFMLRHVEGRPIREVAAALGLKSEATKNSIFRAVRKMRAALEPFVHA
jgi:RNA polymerase sigma-70 factor (ECF subfamily)